MEDINQKHLIVIAGPTASGKTGLSIALAKALNTEVISADSRQFYKEMAIGTAKPSKEELQGIPHYFVDSHGLEDAITSARFEHEALNILNEIYLKQDVAILTGGSGMFIDALCYGLDDLPHDADVRKKLTDRCNTEGLEQLVAELTKKDPEIIKHIDTQNPARVIRALEVIQLTGLPYSSQRLNTQKERPFEIHYFVLEHPREQLYERINQRVDIMMEAGLLDEVKSLIPYRDMQVLNTVGYKELFEFLDGNCTLEMAIEQIKQNTRRYAKRQLTWFRRNKQAQWISYSTVHQLVNDVKARCPSIPQKLWNNN